jgi:Holliday junction DNA helicase RuvA
MIFKLKGRVVLKEENYLILEVNGFGLQIFVTDFLLDKIKFDDNLSLFTYLYLKDETIELYGFETKEELDFFKQLNALPTIGPKTAISVLSLAKLPDIKKAILDGNVSFLTKVSGIGKKTAERIIIEMKSQIETMKSEIGQSDGNEEVLEGLLHLGYSLQQARQALRKIPDEIKAPEERLKKALQILSQG